MVIMGSDVRSSARHDLLRHEDHEAMKRLRHEGQRNEKRQKDRNDLRHEDQCHFLHLRQRLQKRNGKADDKRDHHHRCGNLEHDVDRLPREVENFRSVMATSNTLFSVLNGDSILDVYLQLGYFFPVLGQVRFSKRFTSRDL